jgi:hypothetical protein
MALLNKPDSLVYAAKGIWMMLRGNQTTMNFSLGLIIVMLSAHAGQLKRTERFLLTLSILIVTMSDMVKKTLDQFQNRFPTKMSIE